jgi:U3 small nucleolar ribonucleoprotein protein IMP4
MTVVTTSRKPVPELRTFGKDLAFTLQAKYTPRGKGGLEDTISLDTVVIVVSKRGASYLLQLFFQGNIVAEFQFSQFRVEERTGPLNRGLRTGNQAIYESFREYLDIAIADVGSTTICFEGPQKRLYRIAVRP